MEIKHKEVGVLMDKPYPIGSHIQVYK